LFISPLIVSAIDNEEWNKGTITLKTNVSISGEINYNQDYDIVQCKTAHGIKAFSTFNVTAFEYFDKKFEVYRFFKVFEENKGTYKKKAFYEIVLEGEISMLRKKRLFIQNYNVMIQEDLSEEKEFDYYISKDGKIHNLRKFKKTVVNAIMKDKNAEVTSFIEREKLTTYSIRDQLFIIDYYNSLKDPNYIVLSKLLEN
jgi:hypothetical protein